MRAQQIHLSQGQSHTATVIVNVCSWLTSAGGKKTFTFEKVWLLVRLLLLLLLLLNYNQKITITTVITTNSSERHQLHKIHAKVRINN